MVERGARLGGRKGGRRFVEAFRRPHYTVAASAARQHDGGLEDLVRNQRHDIFRSARRGGARCFIS